MAEGGTVCPECGTAVKPGTQFCGNCGAKVPQAAADASTVDAPAPAFKPRPKARTMMGIDSQASKFASALAEVEARAKSDNEGNKRGNTGSEAPAAESAAEAVESEQAAKSRAEAEAEAEAIIARAQAEAEKAYAAEDNLAATLDAVAAGSGNEPPVSVAAAADGGAGTQALASDSPVADGAAGAEVPGGAEEAHVVDDGAQGSAASSGGAQAGASRRTLAGAASVGAQTAAVSGGAQDAAGSRKTEPGGTGSSALRAVSSSGASDTATSDAAAGAAASGATQGAGGSRRTQAGGAASGTLGASASGGTSGATASGGASGASAGGGASGAAAGGGASGAVASGSASGAAASGAASSGAAQDAAASGGASGGGATAAGAGGAAGGGGAPAADPSDSPVAPAAQPTAAGKPAPRVIVPERGTPGAARAAVQASRRGLAHTMLGLSDEVIKAASSVPPAPTSSLPPANKDADGGRDSLPRGITPVQVTQVNTSGKRAGGSVPSRAAPRGTLLGIQTSPGSIPAPSRGLGQTQIEGEQPEDGSASSASPSSSAGLGSTRVEGTRGTSLGIGIPQAAPPQAGSKRSAPQGRTMLGVPVASIKPPAAAEPARTSTPERVGSTTRPISEEPSSIPPAVPKRSSARTRNVVILASLALLTIIAMVYLRLSGGSNDADVSARIITGQDGETLLFEVPEAHEGSSVRFGGQEQPLVAGRATFPLASDSLRVGENVVLADVVAPDGETSSARIVLSVFYRIWVDTSSLRVDKPTVDVVVTAVPGTKVTLEGEDVPLDKQGRATKTYPVDIKRPGKGGVIDHVVHYRMQPPEGESVVDELHTRIALATMVIDRPGPDIVTDRESIEIAGGVGKDTQVDIDGTAVPVKDGRFVHTIPLPRPGDYKPRVTAKATGKIPNAVTFNIKRVRDLAQAAREFTYNKDLTYAKIAAEPALYKGQSIAMEGRVYATVPRAGSSVIQMLARPCPSSQRCSVWVVDPQGNEVSVDRYVRILGTVDGEQQFRSEKNEIVTVPKIIARFVLPAKP